MNHLRCEKLTFNNPTKEFRRKLIRAGGVSAQFGILKGVSSFCSEVSFSPAGFKQFSSFILKDEPASFDSWL